MFVLGLGLVSLGQEDRIQSRIKGAGLSFELGLKGIADPASLSLGGSWQLEAEGNRVR